MRVGYRPTGTEVRQLRTLNGLSRKNLADLLGVSIRTVESWEQNRRRVPAPVWLAMYLSLPALGGHWPTETWPDFVVDRIDV